MYPAPELPGPLSSLPGGLVSKRHAVDAYTALHDAMRNITPDCHDDPRFISDTQEAEHLKYLCDACPLFDLCQKFARLEKPPGGIWAGKRWTTRRQGITP